jgi:hypothetical protein
MLMAFLADVRAAPLISEVRRPLGTENELMHCGSESHQPFSAPGAALRAVSDVGDGEAEGRALHCKLERRLAVPGLARVLFGGGEAEPRGAASYGAQAGASQRASSEDTRAPGFLKGWLAGCRHDLLVVSVDGGKLKRRRGAGESLKRRPNISMEPTRDKPLAAAQVTRLGRAAHFGRSATL